MRTDRYCRYKVHTHRREICSVLRLIESLRQKSIRRDTFLCRDLVREASRTNSPPMTSQGYSHVLMTLVDKNLLSIFNHNENKRFRYRIEFESDNLKDILHKM